jgi:transcriptional regulator with XRE-family HTH domain
MADDLRQRFGRLVLANRKRRRLTQQTLAEMTGISVDMINRVERGLTAARFPNIEKLAAALEVDPAELFTPDLPSGAGDRQTLTNVMARLSTLSDRDLVWVERVLDAILKPRT